MKIYKDAISEAYLLLLFFKKQFPASFFAFVYTSIL